MRTPPMESLESRQMLAGVTLITHGRDGHLWGFVQTAADYITARLGGPAQAPQYILTLTPDSSDGHLVPSVTHVNGTGTPQTSASGQIILLVDWTSIDTDTDYSLSYVASVVTDVFKSTQVGGIRLAELPLHEISISRGTGLCDEIAKSLGQSGIWVDQETYCDPNPVGVMGDAPPTIYDNVAFVDNYWRWDGNPNNQSTNGRPVDGAYNLNVQWLNDEMSGWALAHLVPAGYYNGTIDLTATNGGEGPIYPDWYGNTPDKPARDQTGFIYTQIVGAPRPLSGVWAPSGGTGSRTDAGEDGAQWANVTDLSITNGSTFAAGQSIQASYLQQDRDSASTVTFYFDPDQNPYNNNFTQSLGSANQSASDSVNSRQSTVSTNGITPGAYFLCAKVTDPQGNVRYAYGKSVTMTQGTQTTPPPTNVAVLSGDGTLRIVGSNSDDVIRIYQSPSVANRLMANINGTVSKFVLSQVQRVYFYGLDGNDLIGVNERYGAFTLPMRFDGGAGDNTIGGGSGDDIITGGAGDDQLYGSNGNDKIYGNDGDDFISGGNGADRIYGGTGDDSILGGNQNDILYGEDGNDSIDGGNQNDHIFSGTGNDVVLGNTGNDFISDQDNAVDTINGGLGIDSVLGDDIDQLTSVEVTL